MEGTDCQDTYLLTLHAPRPKLNQQGREIATDICNEVKTKAGRELAGCQ